MPPRGSVGSRSVPVCRADTRYAARSARYELDGLPRVGDSTAARQMPSAAMLSAAVTLGAGPPAITAAGSRSSVTYGDSTGSRSRASPVRVMEPAPTTPTRVGVVGLAGPRHGHVTAHLTIDGWAASYRCGVSGRWSNLALLVVVPLAGISGFAMFLFGSGLVWPVALVHAVLGLALVVLIPWKSAVVRRGLRRAPRPGRATSVVLAGSAVLALVTGVAHLFGLLFADSTVTTLQVHVGAGALAVVLTLAHARDRRVRARRTDLSRRSLLRAGFVVGGAGLLTAATQGAGTLQGAPMTRRPTGSFRLTSASTDGIPVTSWLFDAVPSIDPSSWRLTVASNGRSRDWSLQELSQWDDRQTAVLDCTGGWWTEQEWSGVLVSRLLPAGSAGSVEVTSRTGYSRLLSVAPELLLATAVGGTPLTQGHGAPARLVVPGRRGYHWVKWVVRIEHGDRPWWLQPPLPLR